MRKRSLCNAGEKLLQRFQTSGLSPRSDALTWATLLLAVIAAGCAPAATPTPTLWPTWTPLPTPTLTPTPVETPTLPPEPEETFTILADLDRLELYAARIGDGPPLMLIPGGPGDPEAGATGVGPGFDHTIFRPEMDALAENFTLIYYDGRGRGRSGHLADPARFRLTDDVADLESIRASLGYAQWTVLGWGYGATVALFYAREHPERVTQLVLLAPMPARAAWDAETTRVAQNLSIDATQWPADKALARAFLRNDGPDGLPGDARDYRAFLPQIPAETLILWSAGDPTPLAAAQEIRDLMPDAVLRMLTSGGYTPWRENMPGLRAALCDFSGC